MNPPRDPDDPWLGKRTLITGLTGQDGYYLAQTLLKRGCRVTGTVRPEEAEAGEALRIELRGIEVHACDIGDQAGVEETVERFQPEVVYHLAAQSSVGLSWKDPIGTARANAMGTLHFLEALRRQFPLARFVMAGSCDCYNHEAVGPEGISPDSPFKATSPYAATKVLAHQMTLFYRENYGLRTAVAVMFNHTSPRRPEMFVERGIVRNAVRVARGLAEDVVVGSFETRRDWSWAPEVMEGFAALGMMTDPADLVLASGRTMTIADWVRESFRQLGLDEAQHVRIDAARLHAGDRPHTHGNIALAREHLGWEPRMTLERMVRRMIQADLATLEKSGTV